MNEAMNADQNIKGHKVNDCCSFLFFACSPPARTSTSCLRLYLVHNGNGRTKIASQQSPTTHQISSLNNMKYLFSTVALLVLAACSAFTSVPNFNRHPSQSVSCLSMSSSTGIPSEMDDGYWSDEFEDDPCWQNIYDDDCAMSTANLAVFRASTWVKGMPCAEGIEVC